MKHWVLFALGLLLACPGLPAAQGAPSTDWVAAMAGCAQTDTANRLPESCGLFVGNSSVRLWTALAADSPCVSVVNRGFGGAQIGDLMVQFDSVIAPHRPRLVIFYAGTNDLEAGRPRLELKLYSAHRLHLSPVGYAAWQALVAPVLAR